MTVPTTQRAIFVHHAAEGRARTAQVSGAFQDADFELTQRECDMALLRAEGLTAYSIGRALGISERTVHKHLQDADGKIGANDRLSAIRILESAGSPR